MNKHLFAIFTYFATFFLSFFLVSFLTEKPKLKATSCFPSRNVVNKTFQTEQEIQIRTLLTLDQKFGEEYFDGMENATETENLVKRMRDLDNSNLPVPFRKAFQTHTEAWNDYAKHLRKSRNHDASDKECKILNRQINETYNTVLLSAKNFEVDFMP
ncbi:MAG: hypothetical protein ACR2F2_07095 [Pyrinomonadaceae bacterium]